MRHGSDGPLPPRPMALSPDIKAALGVLNLGAIPSSRTELARWVAARHPASQAWGALHTAAYRRLWDALDPEEEPALPRAA